MSKYSLLAKFGADTSQFKRGMKGAKQSTDQFSKQMSSLAGVMAGAFSVRALINFGKQAAELYNIQAQAEAKLTTALDNNAEQFERLKKVAGELQKTTLFGDEKTIEAMSFLAQMKMTESEIKKMIPLIQDFATAQNMDLVSASQLVAKSIGSSTNALSRYGISIEGTAGTSERVTSAMGALNDMVGGQAAAAAKTGTAGAIQLGNAWGDFAEVIGSKLAPAMNSLSGSTAGVLDGMTKLMSSDSLKWWEKLHALFGGGGAAISMLTKGMAEDFEKINANVNMEVPEWVTVMRRDMEATWEAMKKIQIARDSVIQVSALTPKDGPGAIQQEDMSPGTLDIRQTITPDFVAKYQQMATTMQGINEQISESFRSMAIDMTSSFAEGIGEMMAGTAGMGDVLKGLAIQFLGFMQTIGKQMVALGMGVRTFKATLFGNPAAAIVAGVGIIALASALKASISNMGELPKLADGGLAFRPTAAIVGDNPNAYNDPEVIAPLSKLKGMGGNMEVTGEFKIRGNDLVAAVRRTGTRLNTIT